MKNLFILCLFFFSACASAPNLETNKTKPYLGKYTMIKNPREFFILRENNKCYVEFFRYAFSKETENENCVYEIEQKTIYIYTRDRMSREPKTIRTKFDGEQFEINGNIYAKGNDF